MRYSPTNQARVSHAVTPKTLRPTAIARAYAAGLVDGEGCVQIIKHASKSRKHSTYRLRLEVAQNDLPTLVNFVHCVGVPAVVRAVKPDSSQRRQVWRVCYDGPQAYAVIRGIRRYLVRKRAEADVAIEFVRRGRIGLRPGSRGTPSGLWEFREQCYLQIRELRHEGDATWAI